MSSIEEDNIVYEFRKRIRKSLDGIKKEYRNLTNGRGSEPELELCKITHELTDLYKQTKDNRYREIKNNALVDYSNIVLNCKQTGSNYGKY